jgi:hypothetical protein
MWDGYERPVGRLRVLSKTIWVSSAELEAFLVSDPSEEDVRAFIRQAVERAKEARLRDREN